MFSLMFLVIFFSISFCVLIVLNNVFVRLNIGKGTKYIITLLFIGISITSIIVLFTDYKIFEYIFIAQLGLLVLFWSCYGGNSAIKIYRNRAFHEFNEFNENDYEPINTN